MDWPVLGFSQEEKRTANALLPLASVTTLMSVGSIHVVARVEISSFSRLNNILLCVRTAFASCLPQSADTGVSLSSGRS